VQIINGVEVNTEVKPDVMRKVEALDRKFVAIDWIGCGSVVWFAHNKNNGAVYSFGDASSGRAGIGQWKYARGRPVFDGHNLNTRHFEVTSAVGGSDHVIFTIKRKSKRLQRRQSMAVSLRSNSASRESSVVDGLTTAVSNLQTAGDEKDGDSEMADDVRNGSNLGGGGTDFRRFAIPQSVQPKKSRKRTRDQMCPMPIAEECMEPSGDEQDSAEPVVKKPRLNHQAVRTGAAVKPPTTKSKTAHSALD